jgi:hypothetical protein
MRTIGPFELSEYVGLLVIYVALAMSKARTLLFGTPVGVWFTEMMLSPQGVPATES